ncbi:MAG: c-type cytochrome [Pedosphaera sp.]|nr:c-type cytochrome [Pedosphaera sp.]
MDWPQRLDPLSAGGNRLRLKPRLSEYVCHLPMKWNQFLPSALIVASLPLALCAAPPELTREDLPRVPPVEKTNVFKTFQIKKGFTMQLAAAEPLVLDPIEACFDENGRMFVVEMRDYSELREVTPHLGRIRLVMDTDGDGKFDAATVYADNLPWPTAVLCYDGGIFVAATPDIIFLKDTDGDGKADIRKVVFTGYGAGKEKLNVQALVNCLRWGLDNHIHGQTAGNGGTVKRPDAPEDAALPLQGRDFNFDPRGFNLRAENGGGQYGMCFDDHGRKFACSNSRHIMTFMYDAKYADRNPFYNLPPALVDIPVDGPAAEVYRTSPEEAWRVTRTKWRVTGVVQGLIEGGGRSSGYFTSATGISIYRGDAWPESFRGDAFVCDVGSNLIHHKKVRPNGVGLIAERAADEQKVEFITSTDLWFRPVELVNAPDGCLYLCDMYREVIEHPWSLPENIKKLIDLNSGNDRGRIYRIAPDGFKPKPPPQLGKATTAQLVATLENKNAWHRETAARLLFQRQDKSAVALLIKIQQMSKSALARLHALYALDGLGAAKDAQVLTAMLDPDPTVREHGVKLSEKLFVHGVPPAPVWLRLRLMASDPDLAVRYQLAFTLGEVKGSQKIQPLIEIARRDVEASWSRAAILSSLAEGAGPMFTALSADRTFRENKSGQDFLRQLAVLVGAKNERDEINGVLRFLNQLTDAELVFSMTRALGDGLQRAGQPLASIGDSVTNILVLAYAAADNNGLTEAIRLPAVQLLAHLTYGESGKLLLGLLDLKQPQALQLAAITSLAHYTNAPVARDVLQRWNNLTPRVRAEALTMLLARPERAEVLLRSIGSGTIRASALDSTQTKLLMNYRNAAVRQLATRVLAAKPAGTKQQIIDGLSAALRLKGDIAHGKKIYEERCISCHRSSGEGFALGPDFVTVKTTGREKLLTNIVDPNAEVRPEFVSYVVETKDDESLAGLVVNETSTSVTVRQAYGKETVIPRGTIAKVQSSGQSVMPEGLEAGLIAQDLADLLEYISTAPQ